jgi:hypothetical protein
VWGYCEAAGEFYLCCREYSGPYMGGAQRGERLVPCLVWGGNGGDRDQHLLKAVTWQVGGDSSLDALSAVLQRTFYRC